MAVSISYGITCKDEWKELSTLLSFLAPRIRKDYDEIIIQLDNDHTQEVEDVCAEFDLDFYRCSLNKNFASFKNQLFRYCTKNYIFNIDADEIPTQSLIEILPSILELNPDIDLIWVPRMNIVDGITRDHIEKWGWNTSDEYSNIAINYPDYQSRIVKNTPIIKWEGKVHEKIVGAKNISYLPVHSNLELYHHKSLDKQIKQNEFYSKI